MPAKTKRKSTVRSSRTTKKKQNLPQKLLTRLKTKQGIIVIAVIALIGAFMVFRSSAATTNFEAESGSRNNLVTVGSDEAASAGKFAAFAKPTTTTTTNTQRFPGDPNPLVTGKAYWGAAINGNGDPVRHEGPTGKSLSVRRTYFGWADRSTKMVTMAKNDLAANRLPFVSTKTPAWEEMYTGKHDAAIDDMLRKLDALGGPVWLAVHHEPEGGGGGGNGPKGEDDVTGAAGWIKMQKKIRERMDVVGTKNVALVANLMTWTWDSRSGRNPNEWWADNVWDVYTANSYCDGDKCVDGGDNAVTTTMWKNFENFAVGKKIPYGTGEWGDRGQGAGAGADIKKAWDHGFTNKRDLVAWTYFDSNLNSPNGGWELKGAALTSFQDILKNDQRVMRVNDLNRTSSTSTSTTTSYGTITANVNVPESGTYKLWVRMNAPDTTNNAVQAQIDSGAAVKMGDGSITPNTWTWVDWKSASTSDKTSFVLNSGTRKVTLTGIEAGVKVDRVLLTNETCIPKDTGENCTAVTPPPTDNVVTMTSPSNNSTVKGKVPVRVTSSGDVDMVTFRIAKSGEESVWQATDETAPYEWSWDTTKYPNGTYEVVTRTRAAGDPGNVYAERSVTVKVSNASTTADPPLPAPDSQAPSAPTSVRAGLAFDWTKLRYVMNLSWVAATDNNEVVAYQVSRDGTQIGTTSTTQFADSTSLEAGKTYTYSLTASDAAANRSKPGNISVQTQCNWIFCTAMVL